MLKPNRLEAATLSGLSTDAPLETLAMALLERGMGRVVISDGAKGIWGQDAGGTLHHQPAFAGPILSVTGAGDTLMAALVDATLAGVPLREKPPVLLNSSEKKDGTMPWWGVTLIVIAVLALIGVGARQTLKMQGGGKVSSTPAIRVIEPNVDSVISDLTSF